jgi:N4-gp56 family major capsid protein
MSMQGYSTAPSRNLIRAEQQMLLHAEPIIVLGSFGTNKEQPLNKTDTVVFRRLNPFNIQSNGTPNITPQNFVMAEGTTPNSNTIAYTDVSVTLQQYGVLFKFSSKVEMMYEDDIPSDMAQLTGETLAEVAELIRYGVVKAGTTVLYSNGSTRAGVNTPIGLNRLRLAVRTLEANRAKMNTTRLASGPNFGTSPVEPGYVVFIHTDLESDVRNLPGFVKAAEYAQFKTIHEREIGACERFRFVTSPLLAPFLAAGSATLNGCVSVGGANVDVYPITVMAQDAWGSVALKGMGAVKPTILKASEKNHANPLGQFGYVGASFWTSSVRLNENWMVRIEVGATSL